MKVILNIPEKSHDKAVALIEYLKTLDFLTLTQETEEESVPDWHKKIFRERIVTLNSSMLINWDDVRIKFEVE